MPNHFVILLGILLWGHLTPILGKQSQTSPQPFYKNPQWLRTIRVSGLMQLWSWEQRHQWWHSGFQVQYNTQKKEPLIATQFSRDNVLTPGEYFYYSHQPEARFYPPEVADFLDREIGGIHQRITVSPLEIVDAAVRFFQKYHFRPILDESIFHRLKVRHVRILRVLWETGYASEAQLYQRFIQQYPDEAIVFPTFQQELQGLKTVRLIQQKKVGEKQYVMAKVSRAFFEYSLKEVFRRIDPIAKPHNYEQLKKLLQALEE